MVQILLLSFVMAVLWMIFASQFSLAGLVVGYIFGFGVLMLMRINRAIEPNNRPVSFRRIPDQIIAVIQYILRLSLDVILSGMDVARRVTSPTLPIDPIIQRITTQDPDNDAMISALSAHGITITPGELVIDFEQDESGQTIMLVHALDRNLSTIEKLNNDQSKRLKLIKRILGYE
jgi:multicomponent Na+:H+ antiporter subunit E